MTITLDHITEAVDKAISGHVAPNPAWSLDTVAEYMGVSVSWVRRHLSLFGAGVFRLPGNGPIRIRKRAVDTLMAQQSKVFHG